MCSVDRVRLACVEHTCWYAHKARAPLPLFMWYSTCPASPAARLSAASASRSPTTAQTLAGASG